MEIAELTATIVAAYVSKNAVRPGDLPELIASTAGSLALLKKPEPAPEAAAPVPHMPIKKTVTREYIVSLEDGKQYRTLKRHLSGLGMTPEQYREKWSLPRDYPMVAASYSERRSELAKTLGLGRKPAAEVKKPAGRRTKAASK
jgi:predicted transcriptional regulator